MRFVALSVLFVFTSPIALINSHCLDGACEARLTGYRICGSSQWFNIETDLYECINNTVRPKVSVASTTVTSKADGYRISTTTFRRAPASMTPYPRPGDLISPGQTGHSLCTQRNNSVQRSPSAQASYEEGGRMASIYEADHSSVFRCANVRYPDNEFFVALWTQFDDALVGSSQPAPLNCGEQMILKNPVNGRSAVATVIDRCASCVGVGFDPGDPTTDLALVNGATIDLSPKLWAYLYEGVPGSVYDIWYDGPPHPGWSRAPKPLPSKC